MSNITLSIDDELLKQARLRAIQEGTSLSAKMRELLQRYAMGADIDGSPDLSFVENARLFTKDATARPRQLDQGRPAPLAPDGISVDPDHLRSIRGWAREDIYDEPERHGPRPAKKR